MIGVLTSGFGLFSRPGRGSGNASVSGSGSSSVSGNVSGNVNEIERDKVDKTDIPPVDKQITIETDKETGDSVDIGIGKDGSLHITDTETGEHVQFGDDWPDNEFTRLIPKPDFKVSFYSIIDGEFYATFGEVSYDDVRAYAAKARSAGFSNEEEVLDSDMMGIVIYSFTAKNAAGYKLTVYNALGTGWLSIGKSDE